MIRFSMLALLTVPIPVVSAQVSPRLQLVEEARFGNTGEKDKIWFAFDMLTDGRGTTYLLGRTDPTNFRFAAYDSSGRLLRVMGRNGKGPGEFLDVSRARLIGDTLTVIDPALKRLTLLAVGSPLIRDLPKRPLEQGFEWRAMHVYDDRSVLWHYAEHRRTKNAYTEAWVITGRDGKQCDTIARVTVTDPQGEVIPGGIYYVFPDPLPQFPLLGVDRRAQFFTRVDRTGAATSGQTTFTVQRLSRNGRVIWSRQVSYSPQAVPQILVDTVFGNFESRVNQSPYTEGQKKRAIEGVRRQWHPPKFMPPVRQIVVGFDGTVFLQREHTGMSSEWLVLGPDGNLAGTFILPENGRVVDGDVHHVWVLSYDMEADEPQSAKRYRLQH
jgi:hypothetical protein